MGIILEQHPNQDFETNKNAVNSKKASSQNIINQCTMHICFFGEIASANVHTGGIGSFIANLSQSICHQNIRVTAISNVPLQQYRVERNGLNSIYWLPVKTYPFPGLSALLYKRRLNKLIKSIHEEYPIDIIETQEAGQALISVPKGIKRVVRLHGGHLFFCHTLNQKINRKKAWLEKISIKKADGIIGVTAFAFNITRQYHSFEGKKTAVVPYPIDTDRFCPAPNNMESNTNFIPRIYFAGTLTPKKGLSELLDALCILKKQGLLFSAHLYGRDSNVADGGSYKSILLNKVKVNQLEDVVFFEGVLPNLQMPTQLQKASICVFPSHSETQGIVVLEAMAAGKTVIFSNIGPGPETITHEVDGLLCDPFAPEDIAAKIAFALKNPTKCKQMGEQARFKILSHYSLQVVTQANIEFYRNLLNETS